MSKLRNNEQKFKELMEDKDNLNWFIDNYAPSLKESVITSSICPNCKSDKVHVSTHWKKSVCGECDYQWDWKKI